MSACRNQGTAFAERPCGFCHEGPCDAECDSCGEVGADEPEMRCPKSQRSCGHHCNHVWSHDECDWCGFTAGSDDEPPITPISQEST